MDIKHMKMAIQLACKGNGKTSPNPVVGAVIVQRNEVVGKGYHKGSGMAHAEINALRQAGAKAKGADMYVTLEPCNHTGKTPPCTAAILNAGIKSIFVGTKDPNPLVSGRGMRYLKIKGILLKEGVLKKECSGINEVYNKYITTGIPFITLKLAATLDGKIATIKGESKWITSESSRKYVHRMRSEVDAIMVGIETVLKDDPMLTSRLAKEVHPTRIVVDSFLRIPLNARVIGKDGRLILATTKEASTKKIKELEARGARVMVLPAARNGVSLKRLLNRLGRMETSSVLIEGGAKLAASAIKNKLVDKVFVFFAPIILGADGVSMIGGLDVKKLKNACRLQRLSLKNLGKDILVEGYM